MSSQQEDQSLTNLVSALQNVLSLALGLAAVLTAQGFVIVHSHLTFSFRVSRFINVNPNQYLVAGAGFLILFAGILGLAGLIAKIILRRDLKLPKNRAAILISLTIYVIILGAVYGAVGYGNLPTILGGNLPERVALVFEDVEAAEVIGLPIVEKTSNHYAKTDIVWFITDLTDGVLIWDFQTERAIAIKSDLLISIIDTGHATGGPALP